jgi:hypothetical protein
MVKAELPGISVKPGASAGFAIGVSRPLARSGHLDAFCRIVVR